MNLASKSTFLFLCWVVATVATLGSLFFSEVMLFPPCLLCWYQRICMYPLVAIFLMSFWQDDEQGVNYALPLVVIGAAIAFYHNLLYYKILPESAAPCVQGISCTSVHIEWFGFITIPLLSFISFALIAALITLIKRKKHE